MPNHGSQVAVTAKFLYGGLSSVTNGSEVTILAPRFFGAVRVFLWNFFILGIY